MKRIGVLTSGGDSPGMNAAIRAVVRTCCYYGIEALGIRHGYEGLIHDEISELKNTSVGNIIQRGGTMLKTARSKAFMTAEGMEKAYRNLKKHSIDGLVVIGGDGTFKGALEFGNKYDLPIMGIPGTIDNDLAGTDFTIGYDTALNTVIEAVDKIRDTADSHDRLFFVEVMGRDAGLIALRAGIGAGAAAILMPEEVTDSDALIKKLNDSNRRRKSSTIVMVAEGDDAGGAYAIAEKIKPRLPKFDIRVTVLGHIQRGGAPTCMDRLLASRMGLGVVEALLKGRKGEMVGIVNKSYQYTPFEKAVKHIEKLDPEFIKLIDILSV